MKNILLVITLILIPSIYLKLNFEVDYFVEERSVMQNFSPKDYFEGANFNFEKYGTLNEYIGKNGFCYVIVGLSDRDGNADAIFQAAHRDDGSVILYLYSGILSSSPPYFQAQFDHYLEMLRVAVGARPRIGLVLHIAIQPGCKSDNFRPLKFDGVRL